MELFYILVVIVSLYTFAKLRTIHQKRVNFTVCKIFKLEAKKSMRYNVNIWEDLIS